MAAAIRGGCSQSPGLFAVLPTQNGGTLDGRRYTVAPTDVGTLSAWKPMQQLAVSWDKLYNLELDTSVRFVMVE